MKVRLRRRNLGRKRFASLHRTPSTTILGNAVGGSLKHLFGPWEVVVNGEVLSHVARPQNSSSFDWWLLEGKTSI